MDWTQLVLYLDAWIKKGNIVLYHTGSQWQDLSIVKKQWWNPYWKYTIVTQTEIYHNTIYQCEQSSTREMLNKD